MESKEIKVLKEAEKKGIKIFDVMNKVSRQKKADQFIEENANHLSKKHKEQLKNVLVKFQKFLSENGAELV